MILPRRRSIQNNRKPRFTYEENRLIQTIEQIRNELEIKKLDIKNAWKQIRRES